MDFTDCREQQIPRSPIDNKKRKAYYSAKKKRHTIKNHLMVNNRGYILHKVTHKKGCKHDYDVYKRNHPAISKEVVNVFDLGYLGVEKDFKNNYRSYLTERREIKMYKIYSKKRILIEHTICRLKKYSRIMSDTFRNRLRK